MEELDENKVVNEQDHAPSKANEDSSNDNLKEEVGCFAELISFLFPLIGIILYFVNRKKVCDPNTYLSCAGWGIGIRVAMGIAKATIVNSI